MPIKVLLKDFSPILFAQIDPKGNSGIELDLITSKSATKIQWKCEKGHKWQAQVRTRTIERTGCPYCKKRLPSKEYNLYTEKKSLCKEWNKKKNGGLSPKDFLPASMKVVWWICEKGHEWQMSINSRYAGQNCPYCSSRKIGYGNDLQSKHPEIAKDWHKSKNGQILAHQVFPKSNRVVWWKCAKGHVLKASVASRVKSNGCLGCHRHHSTPSIATKEYNFATLYPHLVKYWSPRNTNPPDKYPPKSGELVHFVCDKGHDFSKKLADFSNGKGCPYCSGKLAHKDNNLFDKFPELCKEWDYAKNPKQPSEFTPHSRKKAWWICAKKHSFEATIGNRTGAGKSGCPYCSPTNAKASPDRNFALDHPELLSQWDYRKNGDLNPTEILSGYKKKVHWVCEYGHEWKAVVSSRSSGRGCPKCRLNISSYELRLLSELAVAFPQIEHSSKVDGVEVDLLINGSTKVGIEVDGYPWHMKKLDKDIAKNSHLSERKIRLIRLRDSRLPEIAGRVVIYNSSDGPTKKNIWSVIQIVCKLLNQRIPKEYKDYLKKDGFLNETHYKNLLEWLPKPPPGTSFGDIHPDLCDHWDTEANGKLTPFHLTPASNRKVYWRCSKGHKELVPVGQFVKRINKCIECTNLGFGIKSTRNPKTLAEIFPNLEKYYYHLNPRAFDKIYWNSRTPAGWVCDKGHRFSVSPYFFHKRVHKCTQCAGVEVDKSESLDSESFATKFPELVKSWSAKNIIQPTDVAPHSNISFWWICEKGHEFETSPDRRSKYGCPYCTGQKTSPENSLAHLFPKVATEWDKEANKDKTPHNVAGKSRYKAHWICITCKHKWQAIVSDRTIKNSGCPSCSGRVITGSKQLLVYAPELKKEWDFEKNTHIDVSTVSFRSIKDAFWICSDCRHSYKRRICYRTIRPAKCPNCKFILPIQASL